MPVPLHSRSDSQILARAHALATRERKLTLVLILHLNEIEQRKLHLKQGYSSMFDFCTSALRYSEPAAVRRIRVARCVARFPDVLALLQANEVTVSTISRVSRALTPTNQHVLLARIRGRSQREVDAIAAEYDPHSTLRDSVRAVAVRVSTAVTLPLAVAPAPVARRLTSPESDVPTTAANAASDAVPTSTANAASDAVMTSADTLAPNHACEKDAYRRSDGDFDPVLDVPLAEAFVTERRVQFRFAASEAFKAKFERTQSLAWHRLPVNPSLEDVFELALDFFIERHDPAARLKWRAERREHRRTATSPSRPGPAGVPRAIDATHTAAASRYIAASVRDEVFTRDEGRCTFVGANGRRCGSRNALQIDHVKPVAHGGASTPDNLRLLCAYHNRFEAERLMGPSVRRKE